MDNLDRTNFVGLQSDFSPFMLYGRYEFHAIPIFIHRHDAPVLVQIIIRQVLMENKKNLLVTIFLTYQITKGYLHCNAELMKVRSDILSLENFDQIIGCPRKHSAVFILFCKLQRQSLVVGRTMGAMFHTVCVQICQ
jgi:hypothetical protein